MAKFVGGYEITAECALKVVKRINKLNHGHCEFYRYAYNKNGELFVIYNNRHDIIAETFIPGTVITEDGREVTSLTPKTIAKAKIEVGKKSKVAHLGRIDVYKGFDGQGIGSEILTYFESYCALKKIKTTTLDCLQTFTDGTTTIVYRGERDDKRALEELRRKSQRVIDKNKAFYIKNGYEVQRGREPQNDYLIPMVKTHLVYKKPAVRHIGQTFRKCRLKRDVIKGGTKFKNGSGARLAEMFEKCKRTQPIASPFIVYGAKQL